MNNLLAGLMFLFAGFLKSQNGIDVSQTMDEPAPSSKPASYFKLTAPPPEQTVIKYRSSRISGLDTMARTIWGEARGQGYAGMQAVASVIMNRYYAAQKSNAKARQYGRTIEQICKKPYQFSVWNSNDPNLPRMRNVNSDNSEFRRASLIAARALDGNLPDNTDGADHYLNIKATRKIRGGSLPKWVDLNRKTASIGAHTFLKLG